MIGFMGMTHLGLISAVGAADKGFDVVCFDIDRQVIQNLMLKNLRYVEPQLPELFNKNIDRLHFTHDSNALNKCEIVYVAPDVPTDDLSQSDLSLVQHYINLAYTSLNSNAILVILSQVPPGFTRTVLWKKEQLFYQVETLIFGRAIERTLFPERFILGAEKSNICLPKKLLTFLQAYQCPIIPMNYESAELTKIAINMFLVSTISTTNMLADLCEKVQADWFEIKQALHLDKRIGKEAYLNPGLGISGGNLERDLETFSSLAKFHGTDFSIVEAWKHHSKYQLDWVLKTIHEKVIPVYKKPKFGVLGLSYKKDTSSIKNSPSMYLLSYLNAFQVHCFDPAVCSLPDRFQQTQIVNSHSEAYDGMDVLIIMTPWDEFNQISIQDIAAKLQGSIIIDPYGVLNQNACKSMGLTHYQLGK